MKKLTILFTALAVMALAVSAIALESGSAIPFANTSAASLAVKTSAVYNVRGYSTKTLQLSGVTLGSSPSSITFKNLSGTVIAQCAPSATGPWVGCGRWQDGTGSAVSMTTNSTMTWRDAAAYIRLQWTSGTIGGKIKAWLNWQE